MFAAWTTCHRWKIALAFWAGCFFGTWYWSAADTRAADDSEAPFDLVIRGGRIVDGSGNPWRLGDVAIQGDRVVALARRVEGAARQEIDARGLVVAPGFIDIHSHSDFVLLEDGRAESKIRQGVTTEVLGEGESAGPRPGVLALSGELPDAGGRPWSTLGGYLGVLQESGTAVNVASYVGLNNVWRSVMGDSFARPTEDQYRAMENLVDEAMREGALGLSSQLMTPPGSLATTEDIIRLCRVAARHGGIYSSHIRNEGQGVFDSVREAIRIGKEAGIAVDVIHLKIADQVLWGRMQELVDLIDAARQSGIDVQANVYPYTRGNNDLVSIIPPWAYEGGKAALLERLRDNQQRLRLKRDIENGLPGWYNHYTAVGKDWGRMLVSANNRYQGLTMDRVIALRSSGRQQVDFLDELFDLLLEEEGSVGIVYAHHTEGDMTLALRQPWCSVGSDGSALAVAGPLRRGNPHPRSFGTFPRVLGVYVRDTGLLRLEDAIRKMTSLNAAKAGIGDRGLLRPGCYADITVFDPTRVSDSATYVEPFQYPRGIEYVIVNGVPVLELGTHTGALPGRALRRASAL